MKYLFPITFLLLIPWQNRAQFTALFETPIFVEDARGNRDSVIIGYDPNAQQDFNFIYGERDLQTPFDSVLEVRATRYGLWRDRDVNDNFLMSKKIIGQADSYSTFINCYRTIESIMLLVYAKYEPITMSWDQKVFANNYCRFATTITNHDVPRYVVEWAQDSALLSRSRCMRSDSVFTTELYDGIGFRFYQERELEGMSTDTAFGILIYFKSNDWQYSPCTGDFTTATLSPEVGSPLRVFPNPVYKQLNISSEQANLDYRIFNTQGQLLHTGSERRINIAHFSDGVYFLQLQEENGARITRKFIKQSY